jgi:regulator of sigma E protease
VPPEKEALVHAIGFAALMGLIVLVSAIDIINAINDVPVIR